MQLSIDKVGWDNWDAWERMKEVIHRVDRDREQSSLNKPPVGGGGIPPNKFYIYS